MTLRFVPAALLALGAAACAGDAPGAAAYVDRVRHAWRPLYTNEQFVVALDTANVTRLDDGSRRVWYLTRHAEPRSRFRRRWNLEVTEGLLRCDPVRYKTASVTLYLDGPPALDHRGVTLDEAARAPWQQPRRLSVDDVSMQRACQLLAPRPDSAGVAATPARP
jgi:hypothetical protein